MPSHAPDAHHITNATRLHQNHTTQQHLDKTRTFMEYTFVGLYLTQSLHYI